MNLIAQSDLLNRIAQALHDDSGGSYDELSLQFDHDEEEGWVETAYTVTAGGKAVSRALSPAAVDRVEQLGLELFQAMRAQTGGAWTGFTLQMPKGQPAKVKFAYG